MTNSRPISKIELLRTIATDAEMANKTAPVASGNGFPLLLPVGDGQHWAATELMIDAVRAYALICLDERSYLKSAVTKADWVDWIAQIIGKQLVVARSQGYKDFALTAFEIERSLDEFLSVRNEPFEIVLGCWLIEDDSYYPFEIGSVTFESRQQYVDRISRATA